MARKNYSLSFGMSDGSTQSVEFSVPYDDSGEIPEYWQSALHDGVAAIHTAVENAGRNKSAFLWYTDAHWGYGSGITHKLLKYLQDHTAMNQVNFGGDIANDYENPDTGKTDDQWMEVMRQWRDGVRELCNHHSVVGNHDGNGTVAYLADIKHLYGFLMAPEETRNVMRGGDFYYYVDEPSEKTRYLYLNTSFCTTENATGEEEQGQFVVDALNGVPSEWHVVVIAHIWFLYADTTTPTVGVVPTYCSKLLALFDAYNSRNNGSVTFNSTPVAYDFTNAGGKVEFCIGGHTHVDYDFTSDEGIPVILTETDSFHTRGGYVAAAGDVTEASVSGIVADYNQHSIHVIRVGRGASRQVPITNDTAQYTNVLDEVGYRADTYVSGSSGYVEKEKTGVYLTGFIPVKEGDVIRLKNVTMPHENTYGNKIYHYSSAQVGVNAFSILSDTHPEMLPVFEGGNLVQFTIYRDHIGEYSGYIRLGADNIDSTSIITINEEIP